MDQNIEKQTPVARAVLAGVRFTAREYESSSEESILELRRLLETAGGEAVAWAIQNRPTPEAPTFIGSGKAEELRALIENNQAELLVFDNELSPTQIRNLENITGARVLDRSMLILDIFAMRAKTREGKLQTELAQYQYLLPRLTASYEAMSRLGGGIGTRGPGETKLETDRRHIKSRIRAIEEELKEVERTRTLQRSRRQKGPVPVVALIGYTNAGKSTLFNALTAEHVLAEDKLFATLDPVTRKTALTDTQEMLVTDTVGFIKKLPHHLVKAFRSTLEELCFADLLIHVVDGSDPMWREQSEVALKLVGDLKAGDIPMITVYNKCDKADLSDLPGERDTVFLSAKTGENLDKLKDRMLAKLTEGNRRITVCLPFERGDLLSLLHENGEIVEQEYTAEGTKLTLVAGPELRGRVRDYITEGNDSDSL